MTFLVARPSSAGGDQGEVEARWVRNWVYALPQSEFGKLQMSQQTHLDPAPRLVPTSFDVGVPAWPVGGPAALYGPHYHWVPEHGPRRSEEPVEPTSGGPTHIVQSHRPGSPIPTSPHVSEPENVVTSQIGNRPLVEIQLHSRDGSAPLRACWDSRHAQLLVVSLRAQVTATPAPYPLPRPLPLVKDSIPAHTFPNHETYPGQHKVSEPQDPGTGPP